MGYRGGEPGHFWPKVAGWFLVPAAAGLVTRLVAPMLSSADDAPEKKLNTLLAVTGVAHAVGAMACYYGSEKVESVSTEAFLRGGMWSEMVSTAMIPAMEILASRMQSEAESNAAQGVQAKPPLIAIKGLDAKSNIDNIVNFLTAGASEKLREPQQYQPRLVGVRGT